MEAAIIKAFKEKYEQRLEYGLEYFKGNHLDMVKDICLMVAESTNVTTPIPNVNANVNANLDNHVPKRTHYSPEYLENFVTKHFRSGNEDNVIRIIQLDKYLEHKYRINYNSLRPYLIDKGFVMRLRCNDSSSKLYAEFFDDDIDCEQDTELYIIEKLNHGGSFNPRVSYSGTRR
jgi:hypothetical protein